jgi:competence protein ComEA
MLGDLSREQQLIILGLILIIVAGLGVMAYRHFAGDGPEEVLIEEPEGKIQIERSGEIVIHVTGAVKREGVFRLKFGDRIIDVLNLAGGATASADLSSINLAEKVKDGQKIIVPSKPKIIPRVSGNQDIRRPALNHYGSGPGSSSSKINVNSANEKELCKIKGIGPSTAKRIVEYRNINGPFLKIEDVMKVKSIGKGTFGKIKDGITI